MFPLGFISALQLVWHPASANFPWDGWAVQVADQSPSRLSFVTMEAVRVVVTIGLLTVVSVALELCAVRLW